MKTRLRLLSSRFAHDTRGATAIEYSIIAAGIACAVAAVVTSIGTSVNAMFVSLSDAMK
ncbi:MAG TPA: Flp family type IVb pilin [Pseudolabrys sp.]|jgi:pilus assembly protein Flp/PilA